MAEKIMLVLAGAMAMVEGLLGKDILESVHKVTKLDGFWPPAVGDGEILLDWPVPEEAKRLYNFGTKLAVAVRAHSPTMTVAALDVSQELSKMLFRTHWLVIRREYPMGIGKALGLRKRLNEMVLVELPEKEEEEMENPFAKLLRVLLSGHPEEGPGGTVQ